MSKFLFFIIILFSFSYFSNGQSNSFIVADSISKEPLRAAVRDLKTNRGKHAELDGAIKKTKFKELISISHAGYLNKTLNISSIKDTVFLQSKNELNEVIIMPDSVLKTILKKAFNKLEKNYYQNSFYIEGLYQELILDSSASELRKLSESSIKVLHPSYTLKSKNAPGQVIISKTHRIKNTDYETENFKWFSGPHSILLSDHAKNRERFLNPKYFKNFDYNLVSGTDSSKYFIEFQSKESVEMSGSIVINKDDLAYLQIQKKLTPIIGIYRGVKYSYKEREFIIRYFKYGEYYFPEYCKLEWDFKNNNKRPYRNQWQFWTSKISIDSIQEFKVSDEHNYLDIIGDNTENISSDFKKEYKNVIEFQKKISLEEREEILQFESYRDEKKFNIIEEASLLSKLDKFNSKVRKIRTLYNIQMGVQILPINTIPPSKGFSFDFGSEIYKSNEIPIYDKRLLPIFNYRYNFPVSSFASIYFERFKPLTKSIIQIKYSSLGISHKFILSPSQKPFYMVPNIAFFKQNMGITFKEVLLENDSPFLKTNHFRKGYSSVFDLSNNQYGMKAGLDISLKTWRTSGLFINLNYNYKLKETDPKLKLSQIFFPLFQFKRSMEFALNDPLIMKNDLNKTHIPSLNRNISFGINYRLLL